MDSAADLVATPGPHAAAAADARARRRARTAVWMRGPMELLTAVVLAVAGLLAAWAGFQAGLWDGEQAALYAKAGGARIEAARAQGQAAQRMQIDVQMFSAWLDAAARRKPVIQAYYSDNFRHEFRPVFDAWLARRNAGVMTPATPFTSGDYRLKTMDRAARLETASNQLFEKGQQANRISDGFAQAAVTLSTAMFFGGIAQVFKRPPVRLGLLLLALAFCAWGAVRVISLPVQS